MTLEERIGKTIANLRQKMDMTQETLAELSGISRRYLIDLEVGKRTVSVAVLNNVSRNLGISLPELLSKTETCTPNTPSKKNDTMVQLGMVIRQLRIKYGLSQDALSEKCGIACRYLSDIETGKRQVSVNIIQKIADVFNMKLSELFAMIENMEEAGE